MTSCSSRRRIDGGTTIGTTTGTRHRDENRRSVRVRSRRWRGWCGGGAPTALATTATKSWWAIVALCFLSAWCVLDLAFLSTLDHRLERPTRRRSFPRPRREYATATTIDSSSTHDGDVGTRTTPAVALLLEDAGPDVKCEGAERVVKRIRTAAELEDAKRRVLEPHQRIHVFPNITRTTTPTDQNNNEKDDRPLLVLFVGPGKTGSTTLTTELQRRSSTLKQDGYHYVGKIVTTGGGVDARTTDLVSRNTMTEIEMRALVTRCLVNDDLFVDDAVVVRKLRRVLARHAERRRNVVLASELLVELVRRPGRNEEKWSLLSNDLFPSSTWRVRVVVSYRRYHEWLLSRFNQSHRDVATREDRWPDDPCCPSVPTLRDALDAVASPRDARLRNINVFSLRDEWSPSSSSSSVASEWVLLRGALDEDDDPSSSSSLVRDFFCRALVGATRSCAAVTKKGGGPSVGRRNPSHDLSVDRLATAAWRRGWTPDGVSRGRVREAVQRRYKNDPRLSSSLPLACLSEQQTARLYATSLAYENLMLPGRRAAGLRRAFDEARERAAFCDADPERVLNRAEERWEDFFASLTPND